MNRQLIVILIILLITSCSGTSKLSVNQSASNHHQLSQQIETIFADSAFSNAFWGVYIKSLTTGKVLYKQHENQNFMPASNTKIPTVATALLELGSHFTFETLLYTDGTISDSTLNGNLYIKGFGDPTLYEQFYDSTTVVFNEWADLLKQKGVKKINGGIIGDESAFSEKHLGDGWSFDNFDTWYSAEFGPLQLNENYIDLSIIPPKSRNDEVAIIPNIQSDYFSITSQLIISDTLKTSISVNRDFGTNRFDILGIVQVASDTVFRSPSISNPGLFYASILRETLLKQGFSITGTAGVFHDTLASDSLLRKGFILHRHQSPNGLEILRNLMKRSQNMFAETMPRYLGYLRKGYGSFENGSEVVAENLEKMGIARDSYHYHDGSGLSRYTYFTPWQFVQILEYMVESPLKEDWLSLFPIAGVDGTLKSRMKGSLAEGNVRAKTGTISNVKALSGYVTSQSGEVFVFSFLVNAHLKSNAETNRITDSVLEKMASFNGK